LQPVDRVIYLINPVLRGWVNSFALGNSGECFSFIQDWVEMLGNARASAGRGGVGSGCTTP
jgi:RNA-directed DNA polymerase